MPQDREKPTDLKREALLMFKISRKHANKLKEMANKNQLVDQRDIAQLLLEKAIDEAWGKLTERWEGEISWD